MACARLNLPFVTVLLLLVVGLVSAAVQESYGCAMGGDYYCMQDGGVKLEPIKCHRCRNTLLDVMSAVKVLPPDQRLQRDYCKNLIDTHEDVQNLYKDPFDAALEQCIWPEMLLYDGARECNSASGGQLASCAATANFRECLCNQSYDTKDFNRLNFCFKDGVQIDMKKTCPKGPSRMSDIRSRPTRSPYLIQENQFVNRAGSHANGRRDSEYKCSKTGSYFPPCIDLQFSPVLRVCI